MGNTVLAEAYQYTVEGATAALERGRIEAAWWERLLFGLSIAAMLFVTLFPFYVMVIASIGEDLTSYPVTSDVILPGEVTTAHFEALLQPDSTFLEYFGNSLFVATITAAITVLFAAAGGYSFARLEYYGRSIVARLIIGTYMFAGIVLVVPLFQVIVDLNLVNTLYSLIITHLVKTIPFGLYMLGTYFRSIPRAVEEAALMDGYSRLETIGRITLPLSAPAIIAVYLFSFIMSWNEYLFASIFLRNPDVYTLPVGIHELWGASGYGMAASITMSIPIVVMFLYLQRFMVKGLTLGAVD